MSSTLAPRALETPVRKMVRDFNADLPLFEVPVTVGITVVYDAKMRQAMGLDLVNTIVSIGNEIDKMAARYTAAGKDPNALYTAQVNAALQGQDEGTLAKTAAALQGLNTSAAGLATAALEQTIATNVANAQQAIRDQQEQDRIAAAEQAARDAEQAQQNAAAAAEWRHHHAARFGVEVPRHGCEFGDAAEPAVDAA